MYKLLVHILQKFEVVPNFLFRRCGFGTSLSHYFDRWLIQQLVEYYSTRQAVMFSLLCSSKSPVTSTFNSIYLCARDCCYCCNYTCNLIILFVQDTCTRQSYHTRGPEKLGHFACSYIEKLPTGMYGFWK